MKGVVLNPLKSTVGRFTAKDPWKGKLETPKKNPTNKGGEAIFRRKIPTKYDPISLRTLIIGLNMWIR